MLFELIINQKKKKYVKNTLGQDIIKQSLMKYVHSGSIDHQKNIQQIHRTKCPIYKQCCGLYYKYVFIVYLIKFVT